MRLRAAGVAAALCLLLLTACGGDDTAARLAEQEQQIAELQEQLAAATSTTQVSGEGSTTTATGASSTSAVAATTAPPAGAYRVDEEYLCVIGARPGEEVNVRSGPGSGERLVGTLPHDATGVHATGWAAADADGDEWRQIVYGEETAWVFSAFLTPGACSVGAPAGYCVNQAACTDTPNVRTGLGGAYPVIGTLEAGAVGIRGTGALALDLRGRPWVQIAYEDGAGWVAGWLLDPEPCLPVTCPPPALPWTVTPEAVGPIALGMPVTGLGAATGFTWHFSEDCAPGCLTGTAAGLGVVIFAHEGTVVDEIDVLEAGAARTAEGLEVGDSLASLQSAYGARVLEIGDDGFGGTAVWVDLDGDGGADLVALVAGSTVTALRLPAVLSEGCC